MIEVIKVGCKEITCRNCLSQLRYTEADTSEYHGKDYGGGYDYQKYLPACPVCNRPVVIESY